MVEGKPIGGAGPVQGGRELRVLEQASNRNKSRKEFHYDDSKTSFENNRAGLGRLCGRLALAHGQRSTCAARPPQLPDGPFTLPPLPYPFDALEPHIDAQTMQIHHDKHHAAYVANLNKAVAQFPDLGKKPVEDLLKDLNAVPEKIRTAVRNQGGGHYNHSLFWQMMNKNAGGEPSGELAKAIDKKFGSFGAFKDQFTKAAVGQFGSGWAWLVSDGGELKIESTPNQDSPDQRRQTTFARSGCLGARLLSEIPESPARITSPPGSTSSTGITSRRDSKAREPD